MHILSDQLLFRAVHRALLPWLWSVMPTVDMPSGPWPTVEEAVTAQNFSYETCTMLQCWVFFHWEYLLWELKGFCCHVRVVWILHSGSRVNLMQEIHTNTSCDVFIPYSSKFSQIAIFENFAEFTAHTHYMPRQKFGWNIFMNGLKFAKFTKLKTRENLALYSVW